MLRKCLQLSIGLVALLLSLAVLSRGEDAATDGAVAESVFAEFPQVDRTALRSQALWAGEDGGDKPCAIAVLLTTSKKTPAIGPSVDGLATLRLSVLRRKPKRSIEFICLVTPDVPEKWLEVVRQVGYTVKPTASPIEASEIRNAQIAKETVVDGAMGITEMVKLNAFKMVEYHRVLFVDVDVVFHRHFDELFEPAAALQWTHGGWVIEKMNGGFLVFNPHADGEKHFNAVLDIMREGDFRSGTGWKGSGIGWTYGGRTIQGLLPYYFFKALEKDRVDLEIERCRYNNMVQLKKCVEFPIENVTSNHFTGDCPKPWWCGRSPKPMCRSFVDRWWAIWEVLAALHGHSGKSCRYYKGGYNPVADLLLQRGKKTD